jgi:acid phosphatase
MRSRAAICLYSAFLHAQVDLPAGHPAIASLPGPDLPLRAVVFGDFGSPRKLCIDHADQRRMADAMFTDHQARPFHMGMTVGDNFYEAGVRSLVDPHWKCSWDEIYQRFAIPFFATLGNHDTRGKPEAQVQRSGQENWWMPARYYTYAAGPVRFYALDTDEGSTEAPRMLFRLPLTTKPWSPGQYEWLRNNLQEHSAARWKVVYGHHPIFSSGMHGNDARPRDLAQRLLPLLLQHKVDAYIAGHDHHLQHIEHDGLHLLISGGGGQHLRDPNRAVPSGVTAPAQEKIRSHGYVAIEAEARSLRLSIYTLESSGRTRVFYQKELKK